MIKDIMTANELVTPNQKEINVLKENFPSCFNADGTFDIVRFSEFLKDKVDISHEGYELKFLGKNYAKMLASLDTETVILPDEAHNSLPENVNSENVYISGDNLDGLKHLLKSYAGKIKCIYIDPPYNTGSDGFVYNDKFNFTVEYLVEKLSIDEEQAQRILDLTKRGSASHSAWLMFMYPRLQLAKDLLSSDGLIFISIDDNEQSNLKLVCDDVFGEENFLGMFIINASPSAIDYGHMAKMHEYALMYSKNTTLCLTSQLPDEDKEFKYIDKDGGFNIYPLYNGNIAFNPETRPNLYYPFYVNPNKELDNGFFEIGLEKKDGWIEVYPVKTQKEGISHVWRWGKEKASKNLNGEIVGHLNDNGDYRIVQKSRLTKKTIRSMLMDTSMSSRRGTKEIDDLFNAKVFSFPKPTELIKAFLTVGTYDEEENDCIIVDFFGGSGTTAHSVMNLNANSTSSVKYILIQLPELCDTKSTAYKEGYKTIDQIGMERIIRAAKKIKEEKPDTTSDLGFKHYTLTEVSQTTLDKIEKFDNSGLITDTTVYDEFGIATVLTTWLVHDNYGFVNNCKMVDLAGYTAYWCENHLYLINPGLTEEAIKSLVEKYNSEGTFNPQNIVFFGYNFNYVEMENLKTNVKILRDSEKNLKINLDIRY